VTDGRFDLVIFDCDGVLIDSERIINRAHTETLAACGYEISEKDLLARFCGMSDAAMLGIIEREWGRALPRFYRQRVAELIAQQYHLLLQPVAGVHQALAALKIPVCVASSGTPVQIRLGLEIAGLIDCFAPNLFSATMVASGKPAPDIFLYAAERMGADPEHCLVIEDSLAGIDAAVAARMTAIGFCGGSHCGPQHAAGLRAKGAVLVIDDMRELATAIAALG
jgi:HAD superfamily hydrolase (TIGR01509 family)